MANIANIANKKVWMDPYITNQLGENLIPLIARLFSNGFIIVCNETIIDVGPFHGRCDLVKEHLADSTLIIEFEKRHINDLTLKEPFAWFSSGIITEGARTFSEAIKTLPNAEKIKELYYTITRYAILKGDWISSRAYRGLVALKSKEQDLLNLPHYPSLTDVFTAAKATDQMGVFVDFNTAFAESNAIKHNCNYVLSSSGITQLHNSK